MKLFGSSLGLMEFSAVKTTGNAPSPRRYTIKHAQLEQDVLTCLCVWCIHTRTHICVYIIYTHTIFTGLVQFWEILGVICVTLLCLICVAAGTAVLCSQTQSSWSTEVTTGATLSATHSSLIPVRDETRIHPRWRRIGSHSLVRERQRFSCSGAHLFSLLIVQYYLVNLVVIELAWCIKTVMGILCYHRYKTYLTNYISIDYDNYIMGVHDENIIILFHWLRHQPLDGGDSPSAVRPQGGPRHHHHGHGQSPPFLRGRWRCGDGRKLSQKNPAGVRGRRQWGQLLLRPDDCCRGRSARCYLKRASHRWIPDWLRSFFNGPTDLLLFIILVCPFNFLCVSPLLILLGFYKSDGFGRCIFVGFFLHKWDNEIIVSVVHDRNTGGHF